MAGLNKNNIRKNSKIILNEKNVLYSFLYDLYKKININIENKIKIDVIRSNPSNNFIFI
tara:strand:+ start:1917 stop:2093 length:177 start_codon:yes stop_codon:yes gene_type:complete